MKLKSIRIEGMHKVLDKTYDFTNLNYLFGKNGAGKSTALQAIQLALLGYIPGCNKTNAAIFTHARSKSLSVTAVLEDSTGVDVTIVRTWTGAGSSVSSSVEVQPEGYDIQTIISELELPIYNFNDFVGLTANQLKNWFIQFLPNEEADIDWATELEKALGEMKLVDTDLLNKTVAHITAVAGHGESGLAGVDLVRAVNTKLKDLMSFEKGQLEKAQNTIQSLVFYDDCESDVDIDSLKKQLADLDSTRSLLAGYNAAVSANASVQAMLDQVNAQISGEAVEEDPAYIAAIQKRDEYVEKAKQLLAEEAELKERAEAYRAEAKEINDNNANLQTEYQDLSAKHARLDGEMRAKAQMTAGNGECPYTKKVCESVKEMFEEINAEVRTMIDQMNEIAAKMGTVKAQYDEKASEANLKLNAANTTLSEAQQKATQSSSMLALADESWKEAQRIQGLYARRAELRAQLAEGVPVAPTSKTDEELSAEISSVQDKIIHAEANKQYNDLIDTLTADKFKSESTIEALKLWIKLTDANGLQTRLMEAPFKALESDMTKYLDIMFKGEKLSAAFNLSEKANSFSFGWMKEEKYIPFELLSSGEKCLYTIALMMCITARSKSPLKLILIDDLLDHLDDENAQSMFNSLYSVDDIQFILAGVKKCEFDKADEIIINVVKGE